MHKDLSRVAVIVPTWKAERYIDRFAVPLLEQGIRPGQVLVIDSGPQDDTVARARSYGFLVHQIPPHEFNHGGTRAQASSLVPWAEFLVYITQDAILAAPDTIATLVRAFDDPEMGAVYGRQLPHRDADPFARHACAFNYPARSVVRNFESRKTLGFKAIFLSDTLSAYRRSALEAVGNFPQKIVTAEDTWVAAKMMLDGWKTAYVGEAAVYHSHNMTLLQILRRYFDTGVLHVREGWLRETYGEPSGEGMSFVRSEIAWIRRENPLLLPKLVLRTAAKYFGYKLGRHEALLSNKMKRQLGTIREYWADKAETSSSGR